MDTLKGCNGKRRFLNRKEAKNYIRGMKAKGLMAHYEDGNAHVRAYHCSVCNFFHFGHLPVAVVTGIYTAGDLYAKRRRQEVGRAAREASLSREQAVRP